jgi:hypothetical protein
MGSGMSCHLIQRQRVPFSKPSAAVGDRVKSDLAQQPLATGKGLNRKTHRTPVRSLTSRPHPLRSDDRDEHYDHQRHGGDVGEQSEK